MITSLALSTTRPRKHLIIRILEACNADCFMCEFAKSRDAYRFTPDDMEQLMPQAKAAGVETIRFTGGEPLLHRDILELVKMGSDNGFLMSLITNGAALPRMLPLLKKAGLAQIVVSVDGSRAEAHDGYRNTPGLFDKCMTGLRAAVAAGLSTRVNTVVGPHNYQQMIDLQKVLTQIDVDRWELSALKLSRKIWYSNREDVLERCEPLYISPGVLRPMGKRFYGETAEEQTSFFRRLYPSEAKWKEVPRRRRRHLSCSQQECELHMYVPTPLYLRVGRNLFAGYRSGFDG